MSYPPAPQQGQNSGGVPRQNDPRPDPRAYQYRPIQPTLRIEPPITNAPTLGQYVRSDSRGIPGTRRNRLPGALSFWLGLLSIPMLWVIGQIFAISAFASVAAAFSVVAIFFGLVAFVTGSGRGFGFWGILFALIGNVYVISFLLNVLD